jgi:hypothetical protein
MPNYGTVVASATLALLFPATLAQSQELHAGVAAFGDWRTDAPGVMRKITPADLPQPGATCVYRKLKRGRSGGEVRQGWRVN